MKHNLKSLAALALALALLFTAAGCGKPGGISDPKENPGSSGGSNPGVTPTPGASSHGQPVDKNDLTVMRSMVLQYASNFAVDYCANGCKIITDGVGQKFLWVPEGGEVPDNTGDMTVLQAPLTRIGCFSTTHATLFHAVNSLEQICLVTTAQDKWYIPEVVQRMERGEITFVGRNTAPDYELIAAAQPQLIIVSANTMHGGDEVLAQLDQLGIPYLADSQHLENHPLGRAEWAKLVAALLDLEEEADAYFQGEVDKVNAVEASVPQSDKTTVIQTYVYKGTVYVRNGGDYQTKMLTLAGGDYPFIDLEPESSASTKMTVEDFYVGAADTQVLIYDNTSDTSVSSVADILEHGEYLADIKAIQDGNVWGIQKSYWQAADDVGRMIEEINIILYHPEQWDSLQYFYRLPQG